ncbi:hypothetical protein FKR81_31975 [Lentzea tibetensis]|uniref:Uncharacterized protein n=1 Tax=Lentzea tibetensis TaxID=2591470 RepID=A0A563EM61_9PSEU|nr:hypothetical protein [Lentzea tibetensis]TWP47578.1 hypothetical protein FKR81_31975 [Lentzea tibetensis]
MPVRTTPLVGLRDLVEVLRPPHPVASVYIGSGPASAWPARWRRLVDQLRCDGADPATIREVDLALLAAPAITQAGRTAELVVFAGPGLSPRVFRTPGLGHLDLAWFTAPAHVLPLLAWFQDRPPCVVVVAERSGADVHMAPGGNNTISRAQLRFGEESWERNTRTVAKACEAALAQIGARLLVIAGEPDTARVLREGLTPATRAKVTIRRLRGTRTTEVPIVSLASSSAQLWTAEVLSDFTERCRERGLGVEGAHETLAALSRGRVEQLLVEHPEDVSATAWFGPQPTDVIPGDRVPPFAWSARHSGLLADVAVRAALLSGGRVRVVSPGAPGAPDGGIGGVCRSDLAVVRP